MDVRSWRSMRLLARPSWGALCLTVAACGGAPSKTAAEAPPNTASSEAPLTPVIQAELSDPASIVAALREHYTKYEYRIPMRDGVRLFTMAYVPKDRSRTYPILMTRTPYGVAPYGPDAYVDEKKPGFLLHSIAMYLRSGYILVQQDVRGCYMSEGDFVNVRPHATVKGGVDESTDAYDTIDWLVKNVPANSGKVGVRGGSYQAIEFPFVQRYLKGAAIPPPPEAWVFETGTNEWHSYPSWPPAGVKPVFVSFHAGGKLAASAVGAKEDEAGFDAYVSDPHKPVPYRAKSGVAVDQDYMTDDQRFAARRTDVLTYDMATLENDVTIAGPIEASLWVSTTGTDADFVVKVIDVYPSEHPDPVPNPAGVHMGGYQQLVRAEIMRGKFRNSFEKPVPFEPGEPALVRFTLPDTFHTFRAGHRIMVQVQSSWFPLADRNPQTFTDIYRATDSDFHTETHRIHRTAAMPSGITMGVLRGKI
ncbi:CocE/NonD family hydrolase [Pendulispora albinea]|uniref:CocE/NonD family hydrolase n=1 Tax=Pendulispora albinea TaxID=2741071 RepID=A0ABZ2LRZ4_9BACT